MNKALKQFEINLTSARHLGVVYAAFCDKVTEAIQLDELLRAELVLAVSALDCYVHDLVRIGMGRAFVSTSTMPNAFLESGVSIRFVREMLHATPTDRTVLFDREVRRLHEYKTFQKADKISQALSLVGLTAIWEKVGAGLGMTSSEVRTRLDIVIDRRNRIAHEGDIDPTMGIGAKYPIDFVTTKGAVDLLEAIVRAIDATAVSEMVF